MTGSYVCICWPVSSKIIMQFWTSDPKVDSDEIQADYLSWPQRYQPETPRPGGARQFEAGQSGLRVLWTPSCGRVEQIKASAGSKVPKVTGLDFFDAIARRASARGSSLRSLRPPEN